MDNDILRVCRVCPYRGWAADIALLLLLWVCATNAAAEQSLKTVASALERQPSVIRIVKFKHAPVLPTSERDPSETKMLRDFAAANKLEIKWVEVFRATEALAKLRSGAADLSISALPIENERDSNILASEPLGLRRHRVIGRTDAVVENPLELADMSLAVKLSSPMWPYLNRLRLAVPNLRLEVLPDTISQTNTLEMLSNGTYDAALVDVDVGERPIASHPQLKFLFDLTGREPVFWYSHKSNEKLMAALNGFIRRFHTAYHNPNRDTRTFEDIQKSGVLRVITRLDDSNYFLERGRPAGFELGFARRFANKFGLRLDVLVGRSDAEILNWLREGAGDIVTTRINARTVHGREMYSMSREYRHDPSVLITRADSPIRDPSDLLDKSIAGYEGSTNLVALDDFVDGVAQVIPIQAGVSMAKVLERLEARDIDAFVIDARHISIVLRTHDNLVAGMSIPNAYRYRWTLRSEDTPLIAATDDFIHSEYRDETYNTLERRYVRTKKFPGSVFGTISPFDDLLRTYAEKYSFDWRLIAAQMFQESQFDPSAISHAGAIGLMQLMPDTADWLGVAHPDEPEAAIRAGVKYLNSLRNQFDDHIPMNERTWLALAAYNIGYDRVRRARNLARKTGLNPDKWFGNVEVAIREMSRSLAAAAAGGCRCGQAVIYVRSIRSLYNAYRNLKLVEKTPKRNISPPQPLVMSHDADAKTG
ncbi:MAG: membrane-bound lytic murein transglycosylase F [Gammaproteobacteria bacterium]|jgi:membrane-bound lytic murein transglycosylase F